MPRAADLGIRIGSLPPGPTDSVLDVPGVGLGHATVWRDEPPPPEGRGVARTGVTVLLRRRGRLPPPGPGGRRGAQRRGGVHRVPHRGRVGARSRPRCCLTSTMQLGRVYDAACEILQEREPAVGEDVTIPVVAECDDSFLSDARRMQVELGDVRDAWRAAVDSVGQVIPPQTGSVGAGTGHVVPGLQGRHRDRVAGWSPSGHTVGVLLHGELRPARPAHRRRRPGGPAAAARPVRAGARAGRLVHRRRRHRRPAGRRRLRPARPAGRARAWPGPGSTAHHGSGEIFLACATGIRADRDGASARPAPAHRAGARPVLRGRRRRGGGGGAQLAARLAHGGRAGRPHPRGPAAADEVVRDARRGRRGSDPLGSDRAGQAGWCGAMPR